jgi:UDP-N-acetylmuramyl pentapeptide synthase
VYAAQAGVDGVVSIGRKARLISEAAAKASAQVRTRHFADASAAIDGLSGWLRAGDTILIKGSRSAGLERIMQAWRARQLAGAGAGS